jgi:PAS domain-containing protein
MILRLLRATILPEHVPAVLDALRAEAERVSRWEGILAWTHGIRRDGDLIEGIAVTAWSDYDALLRVAEGDPERDVSDVWRTGVLRDLRVEHYELTEPTDAAGIDLGGEVLGVVWGRIRPNVEAGVQEMVRAIRPTIAAAGVRTLFVGRRVGDQGTELAVVAVWRDRLSLHAFARGRSVGAIDPAFSSQLDAWRFETFDALPSGRTATAATGPAILTIDGDRRCVDTTPGVEAVLGFPGELLLRRPIDDVLDERSRAALSEALASPSRPAPLRLRVAAWPEHRVETVAHLDGPDADGLVALTLTAGEAAATAPTGSAVGV